jgi:hypothetical protein
LLIGKRRYGANDGAIVVGQGFALLHPCDRAREPVARPNGMANVNLIKAGRCQRLHLVLKTPAAVACLAGIGGNGATVEFRGDLLAEDTSQAHLFMADYKTKGIPAEELYGGSQQHGTRCAFPFEPVFIDNAGLESPL